MTAANWSTRLERMLSQQHALTAAGAWVAGPSDLMAVVGLGRAEVANCKVARWLFDPLARHRLGVHMLRALAERLEVPIDDPATVRVEAEVANVVGDTRADIVLFGTRPGRCIVIEAKVDAAEQPQQGGRLEEHWPSADAYVFLTPDGARLPLTRRAGAHWRPLSWRWVADTADAALTSIGESDDPRVRDSRQAVAAWIASARSNLT